MEFYMVRHYIYDGEGGHDDEVVIPWPTEVQAIMYLEKLDNNPYYMDYYFETTEDGSKILSRPGPGQYAYDYYYIEPMVMGQEI